MVQITLNDDVYSALQLRAESAGFADVTSFVTAIAHADFDDPRGTLTYSELQASARQCEQADARLTTSGGRDAIEAFRELGQRFGFDANR
jgi:hypothetical protein